MTADVVIRAEGLGKKYAISHTAERERYVALRDMLVRGAHDLWRRAADMARGRSIVAGDSVEEFWALKDVSFEVKRGEMLGIIGRNGAGKSTLLKILSRITEPSEGRVMINGRVASLLEVGTGFHPELTGRENIYLNGAILGMTRAEIGRKFEEIVAFAEVEKFLDTPVKRYSSGMYVRLAFAVAAHLEPEILVVDEVLAVGDYNFQRKCLGKMQEVRERAGRTVLFVSHNVNAVESLCNRCILLASGRIEAAGSVGDTVAAYLDASVLNGEICLHFHRQMPIDKKAVIEYVELSGRDKDDNNTGIFDFSDQLYLDVQYRLMAEISNAHCGIEVCAEDEVIFVSFDTDKDPDLLNRRRAGVYRVLVQLPRELLKPGRYFINVTFGIPQGEIIDRVVHAVEFEVILRDEYCSTISYAPHRRGVVACNIYWETAHVTSSPATEQVMVDQHTNWGRS